MVILNCPNITAIKVASIINIMTAGITAMLLLKKQRAI